MIAEARSNAGRIPALAHKPFNDGADARHRGESLASNPHPGWTRTSAWWERGWREVDENWACLARWPVRCIPLVLPDLDYGEVA